MKSLALNNWRDAIAWFVTYVASVTKGIIYGIKRLHIGKIALCFSDLEEIVSNALLQLLALIPCNGWIVTSELSFKKKVDMMASLVRQRLPSTRFNVGDDPPVEVLDELVKILFQAEELHNRIMHSSWVLARLESYVRLY